MSRYLEMKRGSNCEHQWTQVWRLTGCWISMTAAQAAVLLALLMMGLGLALSGALMLRARVACAAQRAAAGHLPQELAQRFPALGGQLAPRAEFAATSQRVGGREI